ncbi:MAG: choice-of-anchor tandem repeat GloVer-containing protein [Rhizomicrobium sp.]
MAEGQSTGLKPNAKKTKWKLTALYSFCYPCSSGSEPIAGLTYQGAHLGQLYDGDSPLFGVTLYGGANSGGVAFELAFEGKTPTYTVLHDFCLDEQCGDGKQPESSLVMDEAGNLFGTTRDGGSDIQFSGTVFEISPSASVIRRRRSTTSVKNPIAETECFHAVL